MRASLHKNPFAAGAATRGRAANIFQKLESAGNRGSKIYFFGHSENPVATGPKETVESAAADPEQNLKSPFRIDEVRDNRGPGKSAVVLERCKVRSGLKSSLARVIQND
jgi:hypothetical protein